MRSAHYNFCLQKWTYFLLLDKQDSLSALIPAVSFFSRYNQITYYKLWLLSFELSSFFLSFLDHSSRPSWIKVCGPQNEKIGVSVKNLLLSWWKRKEIDSRGHFSNCLIGDCRNQVCLHHLPFLSACQFVCPTVKLAVWKTTTFSPTGIPPFMQRNLQKLQILSHSRWDRCPIKTHSRLLQTLP